MDPVTTGIGGALIANALPEERRGPIGVWVMVGASMFPDVDVFAPALTGDPLTIYTIHRGFTHSLFGVVILAPLLSLAARAAGKDKSYPRLLGLCALALVWHIFTDAPTTWGTIVFFPFSWERVAWDWIFIIDLYYTSLLVLPLLLAWIYAGRKDRFGLNDDRLALRILGSWLLVNGFIHAGLTIAARALDERIPFAVYVAVSLTLAAVLLAPLVRRWGFAQRREIFARAGLVVFAGYVALTAVTHSIALGRVETLAAQKGLEPERVAALPQPLSPMRWAGMVMTEDGVYVNRFHLLDAPPEEFRFLPSDHDGYVGQAREVPAAKTYLWFARFPVARYRNSGERHVVDFAAMRFNLAGLAEEETRVRFGFRVVFDADGELVSAGRPARE